MEVEQLALFFGPLALFSIIRARGRLDWAIGLGLAFPYGWIVTIGSNGINGAYLVGVIAGVVLIVRLLSSRTSARRHVPGKSLLVLFASYSMMITALAPIVFSGIPVIPMSFAGELGHLTPAPLAISMSNITSLAYLFVGMAIVIYLGTTEKVTAWPLGAALAMSIFLSAWSVVADITAVVPFPAGFFDNIRGAVIVESDALGNPRYRGIFTEPSTLALHSLVTIAFFGLGWGALKSIASKVAGAAAIVAASFTLVISTSSTAIVAGTAIGGFIVAHFVIEFVLRRKKVPIAGFIVGLVAAGVVLGTAPAWVPHLIGGAVDKTLSTSFATRAGGNVFSLSVLASTLGLGAGIGSNRSYALWAHLLSSVGLPGTAMFLAFCWKILKASAHVEEFRGAWWALVALLITGMISGLTLTFGLLWVMLGTLAQAAWAPSAADPSGADAPMSGLLAERET